MTDTETVPTVGSRIGRYLILREVAQGTLGPLFIDEREVGEGVSYGLARVVVLPTELQAHEEQALADAIWDSTHLAHDLVLRVADVVTDKGSLTLIHEHSEGSLLEFLQTCAKDTKGAFPAKVASRIALDVIEGLEQSRDHCATAGIPWRPGSVSPCSLLLGPDGRVRAMDGQITAAALRVAAMRQRTGVAAYAAPEMFDDTREPSERSDVFAVGVLLWELLTGRSLFEEQGSSANLGHGFKIPKVTQSVPSGTKVPQGLVHTVHTALEADPLKRQSSLRELAVAIVMGVEDVSTYEQVLEFTDALLLPASEQTAPPAASPPIAAAASDMSKSAAAPNIFTVESPGATSTITAEPAPAVAAAITSPAMVPTAASPAAGATDSSAVVAAASQAPVAPSAEPQEEITSEQPTITVDEPVTAPATPVAAVADVAAAQTGGYREKLGTLPGQGTHEKAESPAPSNAVAFEVSRPIERKEVVQKAVAANVPSVAADKVSTEVSRNDAARSPFQLAHDEPIVPIAVKPVQVVGVAPASNLSQSTQSSPRISAKPISAAPQVELDDPAGIPAKRTVQLSMGTLVFGILTTVLAVIVIMLVLQRSPGKSAEMPAASANMVAPSAQPAEQHQVRALGAVPTDPAVAAAPAVEATSVNPPAAGKADHHKHGAGTPGKPGGKAAEGDAPNTDSKSAEQPTNRHYIPNEL